MQARSIWKKVFRKNLTGSASVVDGCRVGLALGLADGDAEGLDGDAVVASRRAACAAAGGVGSAACAAAGAYGRQKASAVATTRSAAGRRGRGGGPPRHDANVALSIAQEETPSATPVPAARMCFC